MTGGIATAPRSPARRIVRLFAWTLAALVALAIALVAAVRFLLFPALSERVDTVAGALSRAVGQRVEVGGLDGRWAGPRIQLDLRDVRILDDQGVTRLELPAMDATLSWRSLLAGKPALQSVALRGPRVLVRRDAGGRVYVAGHAVNADGDAPRAAPSLPEGLGVLETVVLSGGTLVWNDELRGAPPLELANVDLALAFSGGAVAITARTTPPAALATSASLDGRVQIADLSVAAATGTVSAKLSGADLAAWKPWLDQPVDQARGDVSVSLAVAKGVLGNTRVDASLTDVIVRLAPDLPRLELATLGGSFDVGAPDASGRRRVTGRGITVTPAGAAASDRIGPVGFDTSVPFDAAGESSATVADLDLALAARVAHALPLPDAARRLLAEARPRGRIASASARLAGPFGSPRDYKLDATVAGVTVQRADPVPALEDVTGTVSLAPSGGSAMLESGRAEALAIPSLPRAVTLDAVSGSVAWKTSGDAASVRFDRFAVRNRDAHVVVTGTAERDARGEWRADLAADVPRLEGAALVHYLPGLGRDAAQWMRSALLRVPLSAGQLRLRGNLAEFPFSRPGSGVFEASGRVTQGRVAYAPGWPMLEDADAALTLAGGNLRVDLSRARLSGLDVTGARVDLASLLGDAPTQLALDGSVAGPLAGMLRFVQDSPLKSLPGMHHGWTATGPARLGVQLAMGLAGPGTPQTTVTLDFLGNELSGGLIGTAPVSDIRGRVRVSGTQVDAPQLQGKAFGGPFTIALKGDGDAGVGVEGSGTASFGAVARWIDIPAALAPSGQAAYRLSARIGGRAEFIRLESDLKGVALPWPAPLGKAAPETWPARIEYGNSLFEVALGPSIRAKIATRTEAKRTVVERGAVVVGGGEAALPATPGLRVDLSMASLDGDALLGWWRRASLTARGPAQPTTTLASANLVVGELTLLDRRFHDVHATVRPEGARRWQVDLRSREVSGRATYADEGRGAVTANLQRLEIPAAQGASTSTTPSAASLPAMNLQAAQVVLEGLNLGRVALTARNVGSEWRLDQLQATLPDCSLKASGVGAAAQPPRLPRASLDFTVSFQDAGRCLEQLGRPVEVAGGQGTLGGRLAWNGEMTAIDLRSLSGNLSLAARDGRFLQVRQGAVGTILGVLSLQALGDIATLNFGGVFAQGFAFSELAGNARIANGVLTTDDFAMNGTSASVLMSGTINLHARTQDLEVRVAPSLGNAIGAGLTVVNPLLGAGALVANRLFRPRLDLVTLDYRITGTFAAPHVTSGRR